MEKAELFTAFRDFFHTGRSAHMQENYTAIKRLTDTPYPAQPIDWENEEFIFNRLFVGPAAPAAPFVASVYLDSHGEIQGNTTRSVRNFYRSAGLALPEEGAEPEDSLPYELDACRYLLLASELMPDAEELYRTFLCEHLALWLPEFAERALENCEDSTAVRDVLNLLNDRIRNESADLLQNEELS